MKRFWLVLLLALAILAGIVVLRQTNTGIRSTTRSGAEKLVATPARQSTPPESPTPFASPASRDNAEPSVVDPAQVTKGVEDYAKKLDGFINSVGKHPLEPVYSAGQNVRRLMETDSGSGENFLESRTDEQLAPLLNKMKGYHRAGETGQGLLPDWKFFLRQATEKGTPADIAFFSLMVDSVGDGGFPTWTTQVTDDTACTNYGPGTLTKLYGRWHEFQHNFPASYRQDAEQQVQEITSDLTEGDCACEDKKSVIKEFDLFLQSYPDDAISPALRERVRGVQDATLQFRYHCLPN